MNQREVLSTPGPITGASKPATIFWAVLAVVLYLATLYALSVWNTMAATVITVFLGPFIAMIASGIQAYHNGSVALSFLLAFAPVFGAITNSYQRFGTVEGTGYLVVMALFAGSTAHLLGFEVSEPRDGSDVETIAVAVVLVVSGAVFAVARWPGLHEAVVAGILVVSVTVLIWMVREVTS